ncbi:MAG: TIGR04211 family SH3 domain-containing protein [Oceanospirillaceae bacterium]|nr:TIGR04211 family SH3 domain-containing protein [Oceanospirillaceae bacterium]
MKFPISLFIILLSFSASNLSAATRYVSDQLFTYMHSGPSSQFRIIGSVNAGTVIRLIEHNQGSGYSKVVDPKGRSGWIDTKFITKKMPAMLRLPQVEKSLSTAQSELQSIGDKNEASLNSKQQSLSQQIKTNDQLLVQRQELLDKIQALQVDNNRLQNHITNQSEEVEMQWFMKGAGIIILGIFIGLIVPHMPRRKKKNDQWA